MIGLVGTRAIQLPQTVATRLCSDGGQHEVIRKPGVSGPEFGPRLRALKFFLGFIKIFDIYKKLANEVHPEHRCSEALHRFLK